MSAENMFKIEYTITDADVGNSYKHLHHADGIKLLERARCDYLVHLGHPLEELLKQDVLIVVAALNVRYLRELKAGPVTVTCEGIEIAAKTMKFKQVIFNQRQKEAVSAEVGLACVSAQMRRAIAVPAFLVEAFKGK